MCSSEKPVSSAWELQLKGASQQEQESPPSNSSEDVTVDSGVCVQQ